MKTRSIFVAAALMGFYAASASAATIPLNHPKGMALDANGNLYVANFGSGGGGPEAPQGNILAYNPQYAQIAAKSFGGGDINAPTGVAFDSFGKLYVSNAGNWKVTVYDPANGNKQDTTKIITNQVKYPVSIAVDGLDNIWVVNSDGTSPSGSSVTMYGFDGVLLNKGTPPSYTNAVATRGAFVDLAEERGMEYLRTFEVLTNNIQHPLLTIGSSVTAVAFDSKGKQYLGTRDKRLLRCEGVNGGLGCGFLRNIDYVPSGIAVDAQRNRIYVSSDVRGTVDVFKTDGTFITTFH